MRVKYSKGPYVIDMIDLLHESSKGPAQILITYTYNIFVITRDIFLQPNKKKRYWFVNKHIG